jgi:hypothetical protein
MKYFRLLLICTCCFFLFSASRCKRDDPKLDNPCAGQHPVSAAFSVYEDPQYGDAYWVPYKTDTVCTKDVYFKANEKGADAYEWHIGAGVYKTDSVYLTFPTSLYGQAIPITLIVHKKPNTACFPDDIGKDSVVKYIYFKDPSTLINFDGKWFGHRVGSDNDTFTIIIKSQVVLNGKTGEKGTYIYNLRGGCGCPLPTNTGYKELEFFGQDSFCGHPAGNALIKPDNGNSISINYKYDYPKNHALDIFVNFIGVRKK